MLAGAAREGEREVRVGEVRLGYQIHPILPVPPLAAPANTEVSLPLQLTKATVPAESYI